MKALGAIRSWFTEERGRGYRLHVRAVGRFTRGGAWLRWHTRIGLLWFGVEFDREFGGRFGTVGGSLRSVAAALGRYR